MTREEWLNVGSKWKTSSSKLHVLFPALDAIMGDVANKRILDAGCGDGVFVQRSREKGAKAKGVDLSPDSIQACKKRDSSGDYEAMDVTTMSLKETFDYVLSLFVLLSFEKKEIDFKSYQKHGISS